MEEEIVFMTNVLRRMAIHAQKDEFKKLTQNRSYTYIRTKTIKLLVFLNGLGLVKKFFRYDTKS